MRAALRTVLFNQIPLPVWVSRTVASYEQTVNVLSPTAKNRLTEALTTDPYYYATFRRRPAADWLFVLQTSATTTSARSMVKTGVPLRWDCDGTIFNQNDLPAYSRGANNGILICSTRDGRDTLANFDLSFNQFSGALPALNLPAATVFWVQGNQFSGAFPTLNLPSVTNFRAHSNQFVGIFPDIFMPSCRNFEIQNNQFSGISDEITWINSTNNIKNISVANNMLNQASVDLILNRYWLYRTPKANAAGNLTMSLQGGNAAPSATGLSNRADIIAAFTAAGKTATITNS